MIQPQAIGPIPEETVRVARAAFLKGNLYMTMRDEIGTLYNDQDFEALFPTLGQPALSPWRLALVCVMQYIEDMTDRQAADAVRSRIDWKYALSLQLTDPGFDFGVLCEFRHLCVKSKSENEPRKLRFRLQEEHHRLQTIRKQQDTDEWKERYNTRAGVEGTLSQAINAFGLRQARYRNLPKVRLQHQITAVAINVVRMVSWLNGIPHATTRISRFGLLHSLSHKDSKHP